MNKKSNLRITKIVVIIIIIIALLLCGYVFYDYSSMHNLYHLWAPSYKENIHVDLSDYSPLYGYVPIGDIDGYYVRAGIGGGKAYCTFKDLPKEQFAFSYNVNFLSKQGSVYLMNVIKNNNCNIDPLKDWTVKKLELCSVDFESPYQFELTNEWEKFDADYFVPRRIIAQTDQSSTVNDFTKILNRPNDYIYKSDIQALPTAICVLRITFMQSQYMAYETLVVKYGENIYLTDQNPDRITPHSWTYYNKLYLLPQGLSDYIIQSVPNSNWIVQK